MIEYYHFHHLHLQYSVEEIDHFVHQVQFHYMNYLLMMIPNHEYTIYLKNLLKELFIQVSFFLTDERIILSH
jgi:hypothetical protein